MLHTIVMSLLASIFKSERVRRQFLYTYVDLKLIVILWATGGILRILMRGAGERKGAELGGRFWSRAPINRKRFDRWRPPSCSAAVTMVFDEGSGVGNSFFPPHHVSPRHVPRLPIGKPPLHARGSELLLFTL